MFSRIANLIDVNTLIACSKQISQCTNILRCTEKALDYKYLKLLSGVETFPFLTNLDLSMITDIDLSLDLMNKLDYIKSLNIMGILPLEKSITNFKCYDALYQIIKKQERIIEVLEVDLTVFYYLNLCDLNLVNCHFLHINIEKRDEAMSRNEKLEYYLKFLPHDKSDIPFYLRSLKLMISLRNLRSFYVTLNQIRNDHTLNSITIEQTMNKLETVTALSKNCNKSSIIFASIDIIFNDTVQVLSSLENSFDAVLNFSNIYYPNLKKIIFDKYCFQNKNGKECLINPKMVPNVREIDIWDVTKNTFEFTNNISFKYLKKFTVKYVYKNNDKQLQISDLLYIVSKYMHSLEILTIHNNLNVRRVDIEFDISKLEVNNSLQYINMIEPSIKIIQIFAKNGKELKLKFLGLKEVTSDRHSKTLMYINGLIFQKPVDIPSVAKIDDCCSIFIDDPKFDIFHTVHFINYTYGNRYFETLNKPDIYKDKTILITIHSNFGFDLLEKFPDFKEIIICDENPASSKSSCIRIKYNAPFNRLILFLSLIKTELGILLEEKGDIFLSFKKTGEDLHSIKSLIKYFQEKPIYNF